MTTRTPRFQRVLPPLIALALAVVPACERAAPPAPTPTPPPSPPRVRDAGAPRDVPPPLLDAGAIDVPTENVPTDAGPPPDVVDRRDIDELTLDDLQLIAVASSSDGPVAMVTTPSGHGVSLRRGAYVGRPERVGSVGDASPAVRWRVARITASHLIREADGRLTEAPAAVDFERPDPRVPNAREERRLTLFLSAGGQGIGSVRLTGAGGLARDAGRAPR